MKYLWMTLIELCIRSSCSCVVGTGTIVAAVSEAAERRPDIICGKPHLPIFDTVLKLHNVDPKRCIMIGDR